MGKKNSRKFKFYAIALVLMLAGSFMITYGISEWMNNIVIDFSGQLSGNDVTAESGYWLDIQKAVDLVATNGGGNVYIPEGTFNFVTSADGLKAGARVIVPAGVNIFGAPTVKDNEGQVTDWKTVLEVPHEASSFPQNGQEAGTSFQFFQFVGNGDPKKPSRFSDIKLVGYREFKSDSPYWYCGVNIYNVIDWRVDHCFFKHVTADAIFVSAPPNGNFRGVVDHSKFINDYGYVDWWIYDCTVGYGISINPYGTTSWENDITNVLGHYNWNTVFVEDCYFSRWRHCVCSNSGGHFVFRHNTIEKDSVVGSLDGHGVYDYVGTRAMEIYNNTIIDPVINWPPNYASTTPANGVEGYTVNWRGGGGVFYNNVVRNYKFGIFMTNEGSVQKCWPQDIWIWNNNWQNIGFSTVQAESGQQEGIQYFLRAPTQTQDGFTYAPYPYPHPLTLG